MAELRYLIIDGYPKKSREQFDEVGMTLAGQLYADLLLKYQPDSRYEIMYAADQGVELPDKNGLQQYNGVIWPGCNLTVYHDHDERVVKMVNLSKRSYETGVPQFGSCWGVQMAVYAAGGEVKPNPKGREMGIARKIHLTEEGLKHPMYEGKPEVFDGFISHDDEITKLPAGTKWLATNDFTRIQAVSVKHKKGIFWATQYHPEYNLHEVARLIVAREQKLKKMGFFDNNNDFVDYVEKLEILAKDPNRKDIRWQLAIDDDLISESIIQCEFSNWLKKIVIPISKGEQPEPSSF